MTIAREILRNDPSAIAFAEASDEQPPLTYGNVAQIVHAIAHQLDLREFAATDRIAVTAPRGKEGLLLFLAVSSCAVCCPLDPRLLDNELTAALADLGVVCMIDATHEARISRIASALKIAVRTARLSELQLHEAPHRDIRIAADEIALLLQTSGTTSKPKHVALTHANVLAAARAIGTSYAIGPSDCCINPMPHHHVHGLISAGISSLLAGASQFCAPSFAPGAFERALERLHPTWFTGSPVFHLGLLDFFETSKRSPCRTRLRFVRSSSAPFPASAITRYERLFGVPLLENYGMTETASTVCTNLPAPGVRKSGSVGRPIGAEIRIADAAGRRVAQGSEGEVLLRGPSVITSYASGENGSDHFADGWLRTGDVGRIDEDGCLFILGRTKELIKRGGHSVYPLEVDSAMLSHPDIVEAISFSLPHPTLGEELVAAVVARAGATIVADEVRGFLEDKLSTYKIPAAIVGVAEIPKNATGKATRRSMRDAFADRFAMARVPAASGFEDELLQLWRAVIARPELGVTDNVFVHGADPLRAQKIVEAAGTLSLKDIIRNPTVRAQAVLRAARQSVTEEDPSHDQPNLR